MRWRAREVGLRRSPRRGATRCRLTAARPPFPVPPPETTREATEAAFTSYLARGDVGLIIINAPIADTIRSAILAHTDKVPMVLEIPSSGGATKGATQDPIMRRVLQMLGQDV